MIIKHDIIIFKKKNQDGITEDVLCLINGMNPGGLCVEKTQCKKAVSKTCLLTDDKGDDDDNNSNNNTTIVYHYMTG